ncbi:hypothetical protein HMPREF0580_1373 [Mobiluncus mulieris ATCC 35239]|uniref:Uncharacterized protein n=1 Tax=Mobiluncus mulieris ATCC 35239 TaxID=871571 RepID=E0QR58_9ACTO|nr:hypothetical protein HMPREF0577_0757 [Mobiluncus mulieris ATCC 35243]EFM46051.1 hypothetical protein HMPREF0580_1373 [Mobiluncus mulieris ATCC 35239]
MFWEQSAFGGVSGLLPGRSWGFVWVHEVLSGTFGPFCSLMD